ncbi:MAG: hypothetical protein IJD95_01950 [Clostridia bacterium]|nr:hypothetical protein [Clostridia bacterium]
MKEIREFASKLITPPKEGNPVVMWFWNGEVTEADIHEFLVSFKEQGIYEFFIHPMYDIGVEYLSPRFFELIKYAVAEAKRLKMRYWIYDEYNWPSGIAGGKVLKEGNWAKSKVLSRITADIKSGEEYSAEVEKFVAAHFRSNGETVDISSEMRFERTEKGERVFYKNNRGDGEIFVTYRHVQTKVGSNDMWSRWACYEGGYVDAFNPKAIDKFIEYTYEEYKKAIGHEFGKTVRGIFNDEPAFTDFDDTSKGLIPWSEELADQFKIRNCYDIVSKIYLLFENNETEEELKLKRDYRDTIGELFRKNYIERVSDWAKKNKLEFTAHLLGEEFLTAHTEQFGSFLEAQRLLTVPAIDSVFSGEFIDYERFNVSAAMMDSTAHWLGKQKTLCETYTGSGWKITLGEMKRIANRLMMQGVTTLQYMGAYHCIDGMKKYLLQCYPPSHGPNNILFENYGLLAEYVSRMSAIVSSSVKKASTLVLYPTTTAAMKSRANYIHTWEYSIKNFSEETTYHQMDGAVAAVINSLIMQKVSFEIAFEELFEKCSVEKGKIWFELPSGKAGPYDTVIIPAVKYLRGKTAKIIDEFVRDGGKTVLVNDLPICEVDNFEAITCFGGAETEKFLSCCNEIKKNYGEKRTEYFELAKNVRAIATSEVTLEDRKQVTEALSKALVTLMHEEPAIVRGGDDIMCFTRTVEGINVYLIGNDSKEKQPVKIALTNEKKALIFDIDKGAVTGEFNRNAEFELEGYEAVAVFAGDIERVSALLKALESEKKAVGERVCEEITDMTFKATLGNTLRLSYDICTADISETLVGKELYEAVTSLSPSEFFREKEKCKDPNMALCFVSEIAPDKRYIAKSVFSVINKPKKLELICENVYGQKFILNGVVLKGGKHEKVYDRKNRVFDITSAVSEGNNTLVVVGKTPDYDMPYIVPFAAVRGNFSLDENNAIVTPITDKVFDFTLSGYPHYSGRAVYEFKRRFDGTDKILELETRDYAAVFVNNNFVDERAWPPYRYDLSHYLKKGENTVRIYVTPTMSNLFGETVESGIKKAIILDKKLKE